MNTRLSMKICNMRHIIIIALLCAACGVVRAEEGSVNHYHKKGYVGNVELTAGATFDTAIAETGVQTTHGYSYGNGLFTGFGAGCSFRFDAPSNFAFPAYVDFRYSPVDGGVSPFVDLKLGTIWHLGDEGSGLFVSPSFGLDISRYSFFIRYQYVSEKYAESAVSPYHYISFGASVSF